MPPVPVLTPYTFVSTGLFTVLTGSFLAYQIGLKTEETGDNPRRIRIQESKGLGTALNCGLHSLSLDECVPRDVPRIRIFIINPPSHTILRVLVTRE